MNVRSQGPLSSPGPYEFTCTINNVPHATLTLVIQGVSYVETDATSIIQVLTLSDETPGTYQYICSASNSNGGDTQRDIFTIIGDYLVTIYCSFHAPTDGVRLSAQGNLVLLKLII